MHKRILIAVFVVASVLLFTGCSKANTETAAQPQQSEQNVDNSAAVAGSATGISDDEILPQSPLDIIIKEPEEGATLTEKEVTIVGKTAPGAVVTAIDEIVVADEKGNFTIQLVLENGFQVIEIEASNALGEDKIIELSIDIES